MSETPGDRQTIRPPRKQRSDGERSRNAILQEAAKLATVEGIGGLSIGRLAEAVGMSKSGLFAVSGSKEELQLATIETASAIFAEQVVDPALAEPMGLGRLRALAEGFLKHVEDQVFPGGCFFASVAAEMDTHPGPVRDLAIAVSTDWFEQLTAAIVQAQAEGAIDPRRGSRPARLRRQRLPAARKRAVRGQPGTDADQPGAPLDRAPPRRARSLIAPP